ncbi:hypothetical protein [uncultured Microbacterium sp.]|uniref:hypothetical protein n=1 Tax=uncultured Microbacterium sp. TaxID=191216 RepID=UPI0025F0FA4B|nr:hypothetical protein [uncultured Microbacterium sp.]
MRFISRVEEDAGLRYPGHERAVCFAGARLAALGAGAGALEQPRCRARVARPRLAAAAPAWRGELREPSCTPAQVILAFDLNLYIPLSKVDKIAKTVPEGPGVKLKHALDSSEFKQMVESDPETREMVELALKVEGMARNAGVHAAGAVMSSMPIYEIVPLSSMSGEAVAQFDMNDCADVGLVSSLGRCVRGRRFLPRRLGK